MVERFDLLLRVTQECPVAGLLEDRVSPHREVGTVDLQVEPCSYDSLVFDPHRCREGMEVGNVCGIKAVRVEDSNQAWRRCREKGAVRFVLVNCGQHPSDVTFERRKGAHADRSRAHGSPEICCRGTPALGKLGGNGIII